VPSLCRRATVIWYGAPAAFLMTDSVTIILAFIDRHPLNGLFFQDNVSKPALEKFNQSGF